VEIKTQNSQRKQTEKPDNLFATKADSSICSRQPARLPIFLVNGVGNGFGAMDLKFPHGEIVLMVSILTLFWLWVHKHKRASSYSGFNRAALADACDKTECTPHSRRKPDWVVQEVLRLKVLMATGGCRKVAATFNRLHGAQQHTVGKSFVAHCVKSHQHALVQLRRELHRKRPHPVSVNAVWAMDLTFCMGASGRQHTALGIMDHGSRVLSCLTTVMNRCSWTLLGHLCLAIGRYGKPVKLRTDNERIFTSFVFTTFLKLAGIGHQRIQTCAPWQNGRIERLFGTLKPLLRQLVIPSAAALQMALEEFTLFYNHVRPHQNLAGLTPAEKWNGYCTADIEYTPPKRTVLVQALEGLMMGYYLRR
jgi:putative transposase